MVTAAGNIIPRRCRARLLTRADGAEVETLSATGERDDREECDRFPEAKPHAR
jgi:hypothetical protein